MAVKHVYLIAGEASGDFLGAQLMKAMKAQQPDIQFSGVGGDLMTSEGLNSLFPMEDLSVMGIWEVLPRLRLILKRIKQTKDDIIGVKPDMVISIDAPDFSFRVQKKVREAYDGAQEIAPKLVHYVAPTVWAWRPKRANKIARFLDTIICLFDFEPDYFKRVGLKAISVGHPMMESGLNEAKPALVGGEGVKKIGVLLGSRRGELKRTAPAIIKAIKKIKEQSPDVELIVPTLPRLKNRVKELILPLDLPMTVSTEAKDKWALFKACDVAIAVSGTVGLELAAANVPHVIVYKANPITVAVIKRVIKTKFAHLANIILQKEIVPEYIQEKASPDNIAKGALTLLNDQSACDQQKQAFEQVRQSIGSGKTPSKAAAEYLLNL